MRRSFNIRKQSSDTGLSLKDKVTLFVSVVALLLSIFTFFRDNILHQHVLRATVVGLGQKDQYLDADVLLINAGKHYETLYDTKVIFSSDFCKVNGLLAEGGLGPTVIKPGEAIVLKLVAKRPEILTRCIEEQRTTEMSVGVRFRAFDRSGNFTNEGKIYRYTTLKYQNGYPSASVPSLDVNDKLMDLL